MLHSSGRPPCESPWPSGRRAMVGILRQNYRCTNLVRTARSVHVFVSEISLTVKSVKASTVPPLAITNPPKRDYLSVSGFWSFRGPLDTSCTLVILTYLYLYRTTVLSVICNKCAKRYFSITYFPKLWLLGTESIFLIYIGGFHGSEISLTKDFTNKFMDWSYHKNQFNGCTVLYCSAVL